MSRDRDVFWKLVEPEHLRARAYCRKLMANRDDGDDLYQDSLVSALTRFRNLREVEAFRPWLYQIIINAFKNRCRRSWWRKLLPLTADIEANLEGENPVPVQAARRRLERAFKALMPAERALITLHELHGWGIAELAALTGTSEGNIRVRLSRSRRKMRDVLIRHFRQAGTARLMKPVQSEDKACVAQKPVKD
jgi:RNA polymerase sigma-70 factor (ECF subfamily)